MKTYMPLNGLRWSHNSGSANCDMPQSVVFGRPGGRMLSGEYPLGVYIQKLYPLFTFPLKDSVFWEWATPIPVNIRERAKINDFMMAQ